MPPSKPSAGIAELSVPLPQRFSTVEIKAKADGELGRSYVTRTRLALVLGVLTLLLGAVVAIAVSFGSVQISVLRAMRDGASPDHAIFFTARVPRVVMGLIVGAVLASVGAALQALVRNPLAEGGILGISGGAALGAILALIFGAHFGSTELLVPLCAFVVALATTVAIYRLAQINGRLEPFSLLLVGVIFNAMWGAAILLINSLVNFYHADSILFWLMGSLAAPTYQESIVTGVLGAIGFAVLFYYARDMNLLSLGDEAAGDLGVDVDWVRRAIFISTSVMIGVTVSVSGMIGFVGLIVPHLLRLAFGADHRLLLPACAIGGAAFMVAADLVARTVIAPAELPVGVITALCGGPFFIFLLRREGRTTIGVV
jgi:iron complex transport system permease protein